MSLNPSSRGKSRTTNYEKETAYKKDARVELYTMMLTGINDKFYESGQEQIDRLRSLLGLCEPEFVAKLCVYARTKGHMRTAPIVLLVEFIKSLKNRPAEYKHLIAPAIAGTIQRADEVTEFLAYWSYTGAYTKGKPELNKLSSLPNQLKKGIAKAMNKFNEYNYAKYNRTHKAVTFRDALKVVHPEPVNEKQSLLFKKILEDKLETPETWEVKISASEGDMLKKKIAWEKLIEDKLGYMAMLRNIRNMVASGVSISHMRKVAAKLGSEEEVLRSKQFPYRFLSAYRELQGCMQDRAMPLIMDALEDATRVSARFLPFPAEERIACFSDTSGSMNRPVSARSKIQFVDIGLLFSSLIVTRYRTAVCGVFGDTLEIVPVTGKDPLSTTDRLSGINVGYSTHGYLTIQHLLDNKQVMDRIFLFTDGQMYGGGFGFHRRSPQECLSTPDVSAIMRVWVEYRKLAPEAKLYLVDLTGYHNTPLYSGGNNVTLISGWSNEVFKIIRSLETAGSVLDEVMATVLTEEPAKPEPTEKQEEILL